MESPELLAEGWLPITLLGGIVVLLARLEAIAGNEEQVDANYQTLEDQIYEERCRVTYSFAEKVLRGDRSEPGVPRWVRIYRKDLHSIEDEHRILRRSRRKYNNLRSSFEWSLFAGAGAATVGLLGAVWHVRWGGPALLIWIPSGVASVCLILGLLMGRWTQRIGRNLRTFGDRAIYRKIRGDDQ